MKVYDIHLIQPVGTDIELMSEALTDTIYLSMYAGTTPIEL